MIDVIAIIVAVIVVVAVVIHSVIHSTVIVSLGGTSPTTASLEVFRAFLVGFMTLSVIIARISR
jgi:hypothetical protein